MENEKKTSNRLTNLQVTKLYNAIEENPEIITDNSAYDAMVVLTMQLGFVMSQSSIKRAADDSNLQFLKKQSANRGLSSYQHEKKTIILASTIREICKDLNMNIPHLDMIVGKKSLDDIEASHDLWIKTK